MDSVKFLVSEKNDFFFYFAIGSNDKPLSCSADHLGFRVAKRKIHVESLLTVFFSVENKDS